MPQWISYFWDHYESLVNRYRISSIFGHMNYFFFAIHTIGFLNPLENIIIFALHCNTRVNELAAIKSLVLKTKTKKKRENLSSRQSLKRC